MSRCFLEIDCPQRSPEWFRHRLGCVTSSTAHKMMAKTKSGGYSTSRQNLIMQLALERITGKPCEPVWESAAMAQGREREVAALGLYEALTGSIVHRSGFLRHTEILCGASIDGHLGDFDVVVEAKSPIPATHWEYLSKASTLPPQEQLPAEYYTQVLHQLFVTGAKACDWLSYCPEFPDPAQVKLVRVPRNDIELKSYELALRLFLGEVDRQVDAIQQVVVDLREAVR